MSIICYIYLMLLLVLIIQYCYIINSLCYILFTYTTIQRFGVRKIFFKGISHFILQGCIQLIKSDNKHIYLKK